MQYLLKNGYEILHRNYRKSFGEIDIIARRDGVVSFVEVKTRHYRPMTQPWEAVGYRKQQRIIQTAQAYLIEYDVHAFCRFDVCEVIVDSKTLNLLHLQLPAPVLEFTGIIANANAFMAMLMIGVGFHIGGNRDQISSMIRILGLRDGVATVLAMLFYFALPFDLEVRQALVILTFSPIASAVPAFTAELKEDAGLSSAINSISIVISIVIIVTLLTLML